MAEGEANNLEQVMTWYLEWFGSGVSWGPSFNGETETDQLIRSRGGKQEILEIEHRALLLLSKVLSPDVPIQFALSVIESVAYVTARFAAADRRNGRLYKDAALRILRDGLNVVSSSGS
jgi:hypothetical protein